METILPIENTSDIKSLARQKSENALSTNVVTTHALGTAVDNPELIHPSADSVVEKELVINPKKNVLTKEDVKSPELTRLRKQTILLLSLSLVSESRSASEVTINGYRSVFLKLTNGSETYSPKSLANLYETLEWMNTEDFDKKKDLLLEEFSIDLNENESFINGLEAYLMKCFTQAKDRYTALQLSMEALRSKELAGFVTLIQQQSGLYSYKLSTQLKRLFRDVLIATLVIGAILFTKFPISILDKIKLLDVVVTGFTIYFITTIFYQSFMDITDIIVSKNKLLYWKKTAAGLLTEQQLTLTVEKPLKGIKTSLFVFYPIIIVTYIAIACVCYNFPGIFN